MVGDRVTDKHLRHLDPLEVWLESGGIRNKRFHKRKNRRTVRRERFEAVRESI